MDEALAEAAIDISGRPFLVWKVAFARAKIGDIDTELFEEFFRAFAINAGITLHVTCLDGRNSHHIAEACFKAAARALRAAVELDPRARRRHPLHQGRAVRFWTVHLRGGAEPVLVPERFSWGAFFFGCDLAAAAPRLDTCDAAVRGDGGDRDPRPAWAGSDPFPARSRSCKASTARI